jgi:hypothetical protein
VRLLLGIDDQLYRVCRIGPAAFRLTKMGPEVLVYDVASVAGDIHCDCGDFVHRREGITREPCKHGAALAALGLLP